MSVSQKSSWKHRLTAVANQVRNTPWLRRLLFICWVLLWVIGGVVALELISRRMFGVWHKEISYRYVQPYLMNGGYAQTSARELADYDIMMGVGGPETYGYANKEGMYIYGFEEEVSSIAARGSFLFQERAHLADDTSGTDIVRIFVIGGSAAYGIGASTKEKRWYAVLERALSANLSREVRLIPAAMIGYVSTQERLVLDWMVLPRQPDAVIIFDGFNDAVLPSIFGTRPGDPYDQGVLYETFYSPLFGVKKWLADHSHFFRAWLHRSLAQALYENEQRILEDPRLLSNYARGTAAVYLDNVQHMLQRCDDESIPCMVFLQPVRDLTRQRQGIEQELDPFALKSYDQILKGMRRMESGNSIHDLTAVFDEPGREQFYMDNVHFTDPGHEIIAEAMYPIVIDAIRVD